MSDCINARAGCATKGVHFHSPRLEITYSENEVTEAWTALRAENAALVAAMEQIRDTVNDPREIAIKALAERGRTKP